jgi:predicted NAD/FAD-binding protein
VVGGGISGLVAAHLLSRRFEVRLFEAAPRLGGHTRTVTVEEGGRRLRVDMGFIVYNRRNYPLFSRLLDRLGVATAESDMSFSVRCERTGLEWNGSSLGGVFAQRRNLLRLSFHRMLWDALRFHRSARRLAVDGVGAGAGPTLGAFLEAEGLRGPVVDHYLVPMTSAIWSAEPEQMLDFPARPLATFLHRHGLLELRGRPRWRYLPGGSSSYLEPLTAPFRSGVVLGRPVARVRRRREGVEVELADGGGGRFDRAVLATHSDQALALLGDGATDAEREVLGAIRYQKSEVALHTDRSFLPRRRRAWASWNYHLNAPGEGSGVRVTYLMNRLQRLDAERCYCVTLNRTAEIDPERVLERASMAHPVYDRAAVAAQRRWPEVSRGRVHFCGAYWGFGFHEDGVASGARVAAAMGVAW